jgi:hypothetical protein
LKFAKELGVHVYLRLEPVLAQMPSPSNPKMVDDELSPMVEIDTPLLLTTPIKVSSEPSNV